MKCTLFLLGALFPAGPALSQDGTPIIDPAQWAIDKTTRDGVMHKLNHDRGFAERTPRQDASSVKSSAAQTCARLPAYRSRFGADDPRLVRLATLCGQRSR